jgi:hypothetical protein
MLEWIENNKTIIFSGFGTAIVIFILGKIFVSKSGNTQKQKSGKNSSNIQAGGDVKINGKNDL